MIHNNKRATRRSFGRRALAFGIAMFAMVTLTAVGFAAWLISSNSVSESDGGVKTQEVTQANIKINVQNVDSNGKLVATASSQITDSNILYNSETGSGDEYNIVFGLPKDATSGLVTYDNKGGKDKPENLKFYFEGYVENWGRVGTLKFSVKVPDQVIEAAGYTKSGDVWTYDNANAKNAYVELPSYALDTNGNSLPLVVGGVKQPDGTKAIEFERNSESDLFETTEITTDGLKIEIIEDQTVDGVSAKVTKFNGWMTFKWGARYGNVNPATTFNSNDWTNVSNTGITRDLKEDGSTALAPYVTNQVMYELISLQAAVNGENTSAKWQTYYGTTLEGDTQTVAKYFEDAGITGAANKTVADMITALKTADSAKAATALAKLQSALGAEIYKDGYKNPTYTLFIEAYVK